MANDFYWTQRPWIDDHDEEVYDLQISIMVYILIVVGLFIFFSLVLGCVLLVLRRSKPKRGIILSSNRVPIPAATQNLAGPARNLQVQPPTNQVFSAQVIPANQNAQALPPHSKPSQQQKPPLYPVVQPVQQHSHESKQIQENPSTTEFHNPVSLPPSYEDDQL